MPVTQVTMALGAWDLTLAEGTPGTVLDAIDFLGHIAVIPGRVDPALYGDNLLSAARYVGVVTGRSDAAEHVLSGAGMAWWLGGDAVGDVYETAVAPSGSTFPNAIRALLPAGGAVTEGTLHSVSGTYSGSHQWETPRTALTYVCDTMSTPSVPVEWRVNGGGTLDAGPVSALYGTAPTGIITRRGTGRDLATVALPGAMTLSSDALDYTTRVVLLAEGTGTSIATGTADAATVPYKDIHGNDAVLTRLVSESETLPGNANSRAALYLAQFTAERQAVELSSTAYDVPGDVACGQYVWVYDPPAGFVDPGNQVMWEGQALHPVKLRVVEMTWPIPAGWTVAYRAGDGTWTDLSGYYVPETGDTSLVVGAFGRSETADGLTPVGDRVNDTGGTDSIAPATPVFGTFYTGSYQSTTTKDTKAQIKATWTTPLNSDGSTVTDGDRFEIRYRPTNGDTTSWHTAFAPWGVEDALIQELTPGVKYAFGIRAVDTSANRSAWSASTNVTAAQDAVAPSTPAAPTVAASRIAIQVTHTLGKATGGTYNLELDLDHLEIHVGATAGFTPSESTLVGCLTANAGLIAGAIPAVGTFPVESVSAVYTKVIAVDRTGNKSAASAGVSATATLIDSAHISDLVASKITAGTMSAAVILGGTIGTAASGARVVMSSTGLDVYNSSGVQVVNMASTGTFTLQTGSTGARTVLNSTGLTAYNSSGTETFQLSSSTGAVSSTGAFTFQTAASGARTVLSSTGLRCYNSSGDEVFYATSSGNVLVEGIIKTGSSYPSVLMGDTTGGYTSGSVILFRATSASVSSPSTYAARIASGSYGDGTQISIITGAITDSVLTSATYRMELVGGMIALGAYTSGGTFSRGFLCYTSGETSMRSGGGLLSIGSSGDISFRGRFANGAGTYEAINVGYATSTDGVTSVSVSYGTTMANSVVPLVTVLDNTSHEVVLSASSTTGFTVAVSPGGLGSWTIYWHSIARA